MPKFVGLVIIVCLALASGCFPRRVYLNVNNAGQRDMNDVHLRSSQGFQTTFGIVAGGTHASHEADIEFSPKDSFTIAWKREDETVHECVINMNIQRPRGLKNKLAFVVSDDNTVKLKTVDDNYRIVE